MRGFERLLKRTRGASGDTIQLKDDRTQPTIEPRAVAVVQAPDTRIVLQQATVALERLQEQQKAVWRDMADLRQAQTAGSDLVGADLKQKQDDIDYLHLVTSCLKEIAVTQQHTLSSLASGLIARDEEIDLLRGAIAKLSRPALPPPSVERQAALLSLPSSSESREIVSDEADDNPGADRLNNDKDVLRFRRHMEFVMAAADHPWIGAERVTPPCAPVVVLTQFGIAPRRNAA